MFKERQPPQLVSVDAVSMHSKPALNQSASVTRSASCTALLVVPLTGTGHAAAPLGQRKAE